MEKRLLERTIPKNNLFSHSRSFFNYVNDSLTFWECGYDTIYRITNHYEIVRKYYLKYENKPSITDDFDYHKMNHPNEIDWLIETNDYLFFRAAFRKDYLRVVYMKNLEKGIRLNNDIFENDIDEGIDFFPQGIACPEVLYQTFSAFEIKEDNMDKKLSWGEQFESMIQSSNNTDNPCIMLVTLKK